MPAKSMSATVSIEKLSKSFGGVTAVDDCSFSIARGGITGLIGPNGAGKTTLFNVIAGHFKPSTGKILFDDRDVTGMAAHRLFHLGIVRTFQIPHEFARMSVLDNLMMVPPKQTGERLFAAWLSWKKVRLQESAIRTKAREVMEFLGIGHLESELAGNLSGGQKKLLELGRTMMTDARVILLDEPAAGVNRTLLRTLSDAIIRLNREHGHTFCIVEHDMDLVKALCDPVVVMSEGQVLTQGTMDDVTRNPAVLEAYFGTRQARP
jgi:branched-chain amino acid transport system ATP-binding protein